ncbi:hypothetical protein [Corynebacterium yudongzhengii]|nr:hypothetical protein [Corynebacterium yudongzhengii]
MNLEEILQPAIEFSSEGIGAAILEFFKFLYELLYPANAEAAHPIEIPE